MWGVEGEGAGPEQGTIGNIGNIKFTSLAPVLFLTQASALIVLRRSHGNTAYGVGWSEVGWARTRRAVLPVISRRLWTGTPVTPHPGTRAGALAPVTYLITAAGNC